MLMNKKIFLASIRLLLGTATLVAIVVQAVYVGQAGAFNPFNYLGYFTNLSNIFAAVAFIVSALYLADSRLPSVKDSLIRGAATLYMAVTGVVYITLLSGEDLGLLIPWVNILTHIIMPLAVVADWLYQPPPAKLRAAQVGTWLIFPAIYLAYSLLRGAIGGWYPYPFLDPDKVGGYGVVSLYCLAILAVFFVLGWLLTKLGNTLKRNVT
jgi:hypothetical protein